MRFLCLLVSVLILSAGAVAPCLAGDPPITDHPRPDYAQAGNWISRPEQPVKAFDVFYMHPTTYGDPVHGMNADLTDAKLNAVTDGVAQHQASVFSESCNVFAPRYRQASGVVLTMSQEERDRYLSVGLEDLVASFQYYMENCNDGRPFLLAGHSQGSNEMLDFLRQYPEMVDKRRLVAAYIIGYTVTQADLEKIGLPLATRPRQTGAIITWNTIGKGGKSPVLHPGALCVNPLTWETGTAEQPKTLDSYANIHLKDGEHIRLDHFTSARIDESGALIIPTPDILDQLSMGMGPNVYHSYDYDFFYGNLVRNVAERCQAWREEHP